MAVINVFEAGARLGSPASRASNARPENSGQMAVARADAALAGTAVNAMAKFQEQMQVADVMAANNEYNLRMGELKNELMQNKEQKAGDNGRLYEEGRQKIIESIMRKGPQTLRFGAGQKAFMNTVDRDWVGQKNAMDAYMLQEGERYQDTQLNNQLLDTVKATVTDFGDDELLAQAERRIEFMGTARYANYGSEKIKAFMNKASAAIYDAAAGAAINSGDYSRAGELLQAYGYKMSPGTRMKLDKLVQERKKSDDELNSFAELYNKYGDDTEAAVGAMKNNAGTINTGAGMEWAQGQIGQQLGVNQCANFVGEVVAHAGGDTSINSSLADGMYLNAQRKGYTFTDRSALKDGDLVFWSVDGSGYEASDDETDVESGTKAYKGITHVGVYDAKTGKVIQSGTHGVSAMDLDAKGYHVVGFARAGRKTKSPTEQAAEEKAYRAFASGKRQERINAANIVIEKTADEMWQAYNEGVRDPGYYNDIVKRVSGNDYSTYQELSKVAKAFTETGTYKLSLEEQMELEDVLASGGVPQDELVEQLREKGCSTETIMSYVKKNQKATASRGKGTDAFNWNGLLGALEERMGGSGKISKEDKLGVKILGQRAVAEYMQEHEGRLPTNDYVLDAMEIGLAKGVGGVRIGGFFGFGETSYTGAQLANHSISSIRDNGRDRIDVWFYGNSEPVTYSKEDFERIMGGK